MQSGKRLIIGDVTKDDIKAFRKVFPYAIILLLMLSYPVRAAVNSTIVCNTNQTLQENITVYKDGNATNLSVSTFCPYDCDNVTKACNPPVYQQNLAGVVIFVLFIIGIVLVYRWLK